MARPLIAMIMGSKSDAGVMRKAAETLDSFDIPFEEKVISAHRSPNQLREYIEKLPSRQIEVIIAGAGKAAHLPGVIASMTTLPVIGVPMHTSDLGGLDSLLSIVQMPRGVPVATVAIGGSVNAAILGGQILGLRHPAIAERLKKHKEELAKPSETK